MSDNIPFEPVDRAFRYNAISDIWEEDDEIGKLVISEETINDLPLSLIFGQERDCYKNVDKVGKVWCSKHLELEEIDREKEQTVRGCRLCKLQGSTGKGVASMTIVGEYIPVRWRVKQDSPQEPLRILADIIYVRSEEIFIWKKFRKAVQPAISLRTAELWADMNLAKFGGVPSTECVLWELRRFGMDERAVPRCVIKAALEGLQKMALFKYGRCFYIGENNYDFWSIQNAVKYPFDINILWYKRFIGRLFDRLFYWSCPDNYPALCRYLEINPPKSVRKSYQERPGALILYFWLTKLGFKDVNAIRLFLVPEFVDKIIFWDVWYDYKERTIRNFAMPFTNSGMDFVFYVRWMLENGKEEMPLARQLLKRFLSGWSPEYDDMLKMFHRYYPLFSEWAKRLVKRRGICTETHDRLAQEISRTDIKQIHVDYPDNVLALNSSVGDISFEVIQDTAGLPVIGRLFHNCVASYCEQVVNGRSVIVVARQKKKLVACIELRLKKSAFNGEKWIELRQALGNCNHRLEGDVLLACRSWAEENKMIIKTEHLQ